MTPKQRQQLNQLKQTTKKRIAPLDTDQIDSLADEVKGYLDVGILLPTTVNWKKEKTIRKAQKALSLMEARLDRIVAIHHDAKRTLQLFASLEYQLLGVLVRVGVLDKKASGPAQQLALASLLPALGRIKARWIGLDIICTQAQQRIASARDSIRQQWRLDDNLRWAQDRNPG